MRKEDYRILIAVSLLLSTSVIALVSANSYVADIYFTSPDSVYTTNEKVELKGTLYQANYSDNGTIATALSNLSSVNVNLTILNSSRGRVSNYTLPTNVNGSFYSGSNYYSNATNITAPSTGGDYYIRAEYKDPNNTVWFSEVGVRVVNQSVDNLKVSSVNAVYFPSETVKLEAEAIRLIGDQIIYRSNVTVNGSLRNESKAGIVNFSCTTGSDGKCRATVTAPSTYGRYILELNDFKAFSSFSVIPFSFSVYMKDELGKSLKNVYAFGEQARIEVKVSNASTSDIYNFSGYIADSAGNVVLSVNSTELNSNNSFRNTFLFTVDALVFDYGSYRVSVTVQKSGDGIIKSATSFEVQDWSFALSKKATKSGFEYGKSVFQNKTIRFEALPTYRKNGTVITNINTTSFAVNVKDNLNNVVSFGNVTWNSTCGKEGCYDLAMQSPLNLGRYTLSVELSYSGSTQVQSRIIDVIDSVLFAQSTNVDGSLKELFGVNEYVYLSLTFYNSTATLINLSDAEIFSVSYMNGTALNYTNVSNFNLVNATNSQSEWAWNSTTQRLKLDVPKTGGVYDVFVFGNNQTVGTSARFIVNPYDVCIVPKDTPGSVGTGSYYVWQFKTTDTIYFEIKAIEANNPLGRATVSNFSSGNSSAYGSGYGKGSGCTVNTEKQQAVNNATITVLEVKNAESGVVQDMNLTDTSCQASDNSGGYSCTVKPVSKWEGGANIVKFKLAGQDGTEDIVYGRFEARAFYLYGWSSNWQNSPSSNITLNVQLYEAGSGWWGSSGGLSGTITLKKVEYMGSSGEWIWPPVDSAYNTSNVSSSTVTSGSGTLTIGAAGAKGGAWKTGYYRALIQGTTTKGDTDYGYAWFGVKLWDVYGQPVECQANGCSYKSYFNSKENITLYIKISEAGSYSYNAAGGSSLKGNVTISVKKIQDCRKWPCTDLNSSKYNATSLNLNESSPWYWNANLNNNSKYLLQINTTTDSWGTGYYNVVLDVNGSDTGYAWFNSIAFYVDAQPTDLGGSNYTYSIRGNKPMYFNVTTTKNYKWGYTYSNSVKYNASDYINATFKDATLRVWDQSTGASIEYNYPEDINVTPSRINGSALFNVSFRNGSWPSGYYWGELVLNNSDGETSTGWLWFNVRPFRVSTSLSNSNIDKTQCANVTLSVYEPSWQTNTPLTGNYSINQVYENVWTGGGSSKTSYTNYTNTSFASAANVTICPNNGKWGGGSWGGYHYLNVVVKDNAQNETDTGWLSFRALPFSISWGSVSGGTSKQTGASIGVPVTITTPSTGANTSANLTSVYQWRYDELFTGREEYVFAVGGCYSNVSSQCNVSGNQNITIYPNTRGWRLGYNYIRADWAEVSDATSKVEDWSSIYIEGRDTYNGYFSSSDKNGNYKYYFNSNENLTTRIYARDSSYNSLDVNITSVSYAYSSGNCWDEWCRSYTTATWSLNGSSGVQTANGNAIIQIAAPSSGWTKGYYYIKATVSGGAGTAIIKGGEVRVKDLVAPNVTISSPTNNQTITATTFSFSATTTENSKCNFDIANYNNFNSWYCYGWNSTNSSNSSTTSQTRGACNTTLYSNYNGSSYYSSYVSDNYYSVNNGSSYFSSSGSTGLSTGGTTHSYTYNVSNLTAQYYGIQLWCYDTDDNYVKELVAFKVNVSGT